MNNKDAPLTALRKFQEFQEPRLYQEPEKKTKYVLIISQYHRAGWGGDFFSILPFSLPNANNHK